MYANSINAENMSKEGFWAEIQFVKRKCGHVGLPMLLRRDFIYNGMWYRHMGDFLRTAGDQFTCDIRHSVSMVKTIVYPPVVADLQKLYAHLCGDAIIPNIDVVVANIDWSHGAVHLHHVMAFALTIAKYMDISPAWIELVMIVVWVHDMTDRKYIQKAEHKAAILDYIGTIGGKYGMTWLRVFVQEAVRCLPFSSRNGVPLDQQYRLDASVFTPHTAQCMADYYGVSVSELNTAIKHVLQIVGDADMAHALYEPLRIFVLASTRINEKYKRWRNNIITVVDRIIYAYRDNYSTEFGRHFHDLMVPGAIAWRDAYANWSIVKIKDAIVPREAVNVFATQEVKSGALTYLRPSPPNIVIRILADPHGVFAEHPYACHDQ